MTGDDQRPPAFRFPVPSGKGVRSAVNEELDFHVAMVVSELVAQGWSAADAEHEARRRFGDLEFTRDYCSAEDLRRIREKRRMISLDELWRDLRYTFRTLRRSPGFTLVVLFTLALGIGANTAIFSVVRAVLLEPLPFVRSDELVRVWHENIADDVHQAWVSEPDYLDWKAGARTAASMGGYFFADGLSGLSLTGDGTPERISAALVTDGFFQTLGTPPLLGRTFTADDQLEGRNRVVVLGYDIWQSRFAGDRNVIGRRIMLNDEPFTVAGVMPQRFSFPAGSSLDAWVPLSFYGPDNIGRSRGAHFLSVVARLKPGATQQQLQQELSGIALEITRKFPDNRGWETVSTKSMREAIVGDVKRPLSLLLGAVALVLLITCVNVASLMLTRASARERELAVRSALGAGRHRIIRQLLTESLTLALAGGALGAVLARAMLPVLVRSGVGDLPRGAGISIDGVVLAFTLGVSLLAGLVFGILPTMRVAGSSVDGALRGGRGAVGATGAKLRSALVVAQVALAVVLVTAAGLTTKSLLRLTRVNLGFNPANALVAEVSIPDRYSEMEGGSGPYYTAVLDAIARVPGVRAVGAMRDLPTKAIGEQRNPEPVGSSTVTPGQGPPVQLHHVSRDIFAALEVPLKAGRLFEPTDRTGAPVVLIVNEELVRRFWPGENGVGKSVRFGNLEARIIGVVGNVRQRGPAEPIEPLMYVHALQQMRSRMSIVVRTTGDPLASAPAVRQAIWSVEKNQPITGVATLESVVGRAVARPRLMASLMLMFGLLGLTLGALGIYGVLAFAVTQRRREIGVRVALGATPRSVLGMVLGQGMTLSLAGVLIGVIGSLALAGTLQAILFDMPAIDPLTFAQVVVVLVVAALLASWLPARRALAIDPATALRSD